jgi:adenine phosphoribosyltransferase
MSGVEYYSLKICNLDRKLPLIYVGRHTRIASFSVLGDVELCDALADEMARRLEKVQFDCLIGPEVKAVPLIHGVAKRLGHKRYVICRKSIKPYMISPIKINPLPHFPKHTKPLVADGKDAYFLKNKRVVVLDDVVSSGVTLRMMKYLLQKVEAEIVECFVAIKQGEQFDSIENLNYLAEIPIFKD